MNDSLPPANMNPTRRGRRSLLPLLILVVAGGLYLWSIRTSSLANERVASIVQEAADAVCSRGPLPEELAWPYSTLKFDFIDAVKPGCGDGGGDGHGPSVHVRAGDLETGDGRATHIATITSASRTLIQLRLHDEDGNRITVLGWQRP